MTPDPRLPLILQETEQRLTAFDEFIERTCGTSPTPSGARTFLGEWRQLRPGLYILLGAAYGGMLKRDPKLPVAHTCPHGVVLLSPCDLCPRGIATEPA